MRNLEIEQSKLKCTDDELILQPDEKIDACQTFAQKTEDKNRRIYDSVLSYVEEQANINIRVGQLEINFTELMEAKPADINEVDSKISKILIGTKTARESFRSEINQRLKQYDQKIFNVNQNCETLFSSVNTILDKTHKTQDSVKANELHIYEHQVAINKTVRSVSKMHSVVKDLRIDVEKNQEEIAKLHRESTKVILGKSIKESVTESNYTDPELFRAIEALSQSIEDANSEIDRIKRSHRKDTLKIQQKFKNASKSMEKVNEWMNNKILLTHDDFRKSMGQVVSAVGKNKRYFQYLNYYVKKHIKDHDQQYDIMFKKHRS